MKILKTVLCVMIALLMIPRVFSAEEDYRASLIEKGFPEDYAEKLSVLHKKHPLWNFEPIDITEMSGGKYTWEYVLYMETDENPKRSLVPNGDQYIVLRDMSNYEQYDSGWWKASREAVSYMLDPRNFMDEKQIFQFYDLAWSDSVTLRMTEAALKGTFMSDARLDGDYSDVTYAEYFYEIGKELGASPVYLAARVRSEQGVSGTSSLINGKCGDKLWYYYKNKVTGSENGHLINAPTSGYTEKQLLSYNGLYNYFNIGAAGTGYFAIYLGGMNEAKNGTPEKAAEWGGPSWNTRWKSLYGGAYKATNTYIKDYQNTPYFQKFNVDPRSSRNFWGQYMQSIHGSTGVATTFYNSFKENKMLDLPYTFLIPVYEGMPESCPYPDGTALQDRKYLDKPAVGSFDTVDLAALPGVKKRFASGKVSWRVFVGQTGSCLDLGDIDLSKYSGALIEYSVDAKFDRDACGVGSYIGFVSDPEHPYGGEGSEQDLSADLGHKRITDGKNGWLHRQTVSVDLSDVSHSGPVYLTAYTQKGQRYLIHNIVFITDKDYDAPEPDVVTRGDDTETVPVTDAETGTAVAATETVTDAETGAVTDAEKTGGFRPLYVVIVAVCSAVIAGGIAVIIISKVPKKEKKDEEG